jgi:esterase/lipase superfamily enzyme
MAVSPGPINSQLQTGNLYGTVFDSENSPLPGVTVTLLGKTSPMVQISDAQGRFRFLGLSPGSYRLEAEVDGFSAIEYPNVLVNVGRNSAIEVILSASTATPKENYAQIEVFFGTDRLAKRTKNPEERFGPERSKLKSIQLGACRVSVPRDHRLGNIERPSIWKLELRPDPKKHMVLLEVRQLAKENFYQHLKATLGKTSGKEILVFIHGFNVSFSDAALRTAQLAYDLGLDGAPVLYSWPSQDAVTKYTMDETNIEWTLPHLEAFLEDVATHSGARSVHLVAHSMGNRALTRALERIAVRKGGETLPLFDQILLTAPDIDASVFSHLAQVFRRVGRRITLYASSNDEALKVSKSVHGYPRAGDSGPNLVVLPGIDTVDVSSVDTSFLGHSYYGDNRSVLSDIFQILRDRQPPDKRFGLKRKNKEGLPYWVFSP